MLSDKGAEARLTPGNEYSVIMEAVFREAETVQRIGSGTEILGYHGAPLTQALVSLYQTLHGSTQQTLLRHIDGVLTAASASTSEETK